MQRPCDGCGEPYEAKRATSRFCSDRCRKRHQREHKPDVTQTEAGQPANADMSADTPAAASGVGLIAQVTRELTAAGRLESALGQAAVVLAARILTSASDAAVASLTKQLRDTLTAALAGAETDADPVDELRQRRERRLRGA